MPTPDAPKERTRRLRWHLSVARRQGDEADRLLALAASLRADGREAEAQRAEWRAHEALSIARAFLGAAEDLALA